MSRLATTFDRLAATRRCGLIPYVAAGHPHPDETLDILLAMAAAGADVIELGVPFSDPMADGPVIQHASEVALRHGVGLTHVLEMAHAFRQRDAVTPLVLMGYANPIERFGLERFPEAAQAAGVDGVLIVDYPPEESTALAARLQQVGLDAIYLISPTTDDERIARIGRAAAGYVYYVSLKGTTGAAHLDIAALRERLPAVRRHVSLPIGVGFGIRDAASAGAVARLADAVVIGSKIVEELDRAPPGEAAATAHRLVAAFRAALDDARDEVDERALAPEKI